MGWRVSVAESGSADEEARYRKGEDDQAPEYYVSVKAESYGCKEEIITFDQVVIKTNGLLYPYHKQDFYEID